MAEVSVVIPAYNAARTLPETLAALTAQTFGDFEAIIVDDGSSDGTAAIAGSTGDSRIRVISLPNGGVAHARNRGISASSGSLVAFLDADDLWRPEKLERQVEALRANPDHGVCVCGAVRIDHSSRVVSPMPLWHPDDVCRELLLHSMVVGCLSSGVVRRGTLDDAGHFDPRFSQSADWDLWLRLAVSTRFLILDEPLVSYRSAPGNMSSDIGLLERDTFGVLGSFYASPHAGPYLRLRRRVYSAHWLVCAGSYLRAGDRRAAVRCLARALAVRPASLGRALAMPARRLRRRIASGAGLP